MSEEEINKLEMNKLDGFLIWVDNKVLKTSDYDLLDYGEIAEIASKEFGEKFGAEHISAALSEISKRKNYYIAPWHDASKPATPAELAN